MTDARFSLKFGILYNHSHPLTDFLFHCRVVLLLFLMLFFPLILHFLCEDEIKNKAHVNWYIRWFFEICPLLEVLTLLAFKF